MSFFTHNLFLSLLHKIERATIRYLNRVFHINPKVLPHLSGEEINKKIYNSLTHNLPCMVCRFGSTEFDSFSYEYSMRLPIFKRYRLYLNGQIPILHRDTSYEENILNTLCNNSGFFPHNYTLMSRYLDLVMADMKEIDILGIWLQEEIFAEQLTKSNFASMKDLEPYDYSAPWSKALKGKKVLIIHPFEKSIKAQYEKKELLWDNPDVLPNFELKTIKAVQTIAGEKAPFNDWFEALEYMKKQMDAIEFDVAIIGCGAYGFHLAAHAKRTGHKAIHLGGATQILFGIKGKRWDEIPAVSKFYNKHWIYPLPEETPRNNQNVEGGCYW